MIQKCPRCGSTNIQYRRENQGEVRRGKKKYIVHKTIGICHDCGKTWDGNRKERSSNPSVGAWVCLWLFLFPVALTIVLYKSNLDKRLKYGLIGAMWGFFVIVGIIGGKNSTETGTSNDYRIEHTELESESNTEVTKSTETDKVGTVESENVTKEADVPVQETTANTVESTSVEEPIVEEPAPDVAALQEVQEPVPEQPVEEIVVTNDEPIVITNDSVSDSVSQQSYSAEQDYVVNVSTGVFHRGGCRMIKKMDEANKTIRHCSRDTLIAEGYSPCGVCGG